MKTCLIIAISSIAGECCRGHQRASDLACLPRLSKSTLRRERVRLRASNADQYGAFEVATSGTTGHPVSFLLDRYANTLEFAYYWRWFGWSGYRLGDRLAGLTSAYFLARPARLRWPFQFQRSFGRLLLNTVEMSHSRVAEFVTALRRYRPEYLKGTPSAVSQFASMLRALGVDDVRFRAVFCTGEMLLTGPAA